jgi:hypothetical protein
MYTTPEVLASIDTASVLGAAYGDIHCDHNSCNNNGGGSGSHN